MTMFKTLISSRVTDHVTRPEEKCEPEAYPMLSDARPDKSWWIILGLGGCRGQQENLQLLAVNVLVIIWKGVGVS